MMNRESAEIEKIKVLRRDNLTYRLHRDVAVCMQMMAKCYDRIAELSTDANEIKRSKEYAEAAREDYRQREGILTAMYEDVCGK